jgi:hypothetical protein
MKGSIRRPGALLLLAAAALLPQAALSGGFEYGVQGTETVARSGAATAKVSGPEALYLNVAGIAKGSGLEFVLDANFIAAGLSADLYNNAVNEWSVTGVTGTIDYPVVDNMTDVYPDGFKMFPAPYVGITFPIPQWKRMSLGFGVFGPAALGAYQYPETMSVTHEGYTYELPGPQRYDLIYQNVLFFWPTVAAAFRLTERLTVGVAFQSGILNLEFTQAINNSTVTTPGSYRNDMLAIFNGWDFFIPAGMFGIAWKPIDRLEMGFSARFSDGINAEGELVSVATPYSDDPIRSDDPTLTWMDQDPYSRPSGTLKFKWPTAVYRMGFRYIHPNRKAPMRQGRPLYPWESELFDLELDIFLEGNHVLDAMKMKVDGQIPIGREEGQVAPFKPTENGTITLRRNWRDVLSVRLGGSVNLLKGHLSIHAGGFYETATTEDADMRLDYMTSQKYGLSVGFQGRYFAIPVKDKRLCIELSVSYVHMFFPKVNVDDGRITHVSSVHPSGTVVNNGDYRFSLDVLSAGLKFQVL